MDDLVASFERLRPRLLRVAYGTLGSLAEAEDTVQEAWLRLERTGPGEIGDLRAWLTTVVTRLSLDALKTARRPARRASRSYEGENLDVLSFTTDAGRIVALDVVRNPDKPRHVRLLDG